MQGVTRALLQGMVLQMNETKQTNLHAIHPRYYMQVQDNLQLREVDLFFPMIRSYVRRQPVIDNRVL